MKILVTGANGFLAKNLIAELRNKGFEDIFEYSRQVSKSTLDWYTSRCDFVFHLAGVNRPNNKEDFKKGNYEFTKELLNLLKKNNNNVPIVFSSSIQADKDNLYGTSKRDGEKILKEYEEETKAEVYIYRLPNLFGKWSKPNYNSVVATFCHNIARGIDIRVDNPESRLNLCYIDDVLTEFLNTLEGNPTCDNGYCYIPVVHSITLENLVNTIYSFAESRNDIHIPDMSDSLTKKLYSTYLTFLSEDKFSYDLKMNIDERGSFSELFRTNERGQVSVNVSKPGISKGNHWHHTKNEKFIVVSGKGLIRFRKYNSEEIIEYRVSGDRLEVVDIPPGYTHSIVNVGRNDLVTVMWANECFDPEKPDTYYLEV